MTTAVQEGGIRCLQDALELINILRVENNHLREDLANIQAGLAGSVQFNQQSTELCQETQEVFEELAQKSQQMSACTIEQSQAVATSRQLVDTSVEQLKAVTSATERIKDLADQTNLLALNAQIEAARAGQAGAGFAIVAQEVKELSNQTDNATRLIEQSVEAIRRTSEDISERMAELEEASNNIQTTVQHVDNMVRSTQDRNEDTLVRVSNCTDRVFMSLAKLDHVIWKVNTYRSVIEGSPQFPFVDYHNCRLGKWYYQGDGHDSFSQTPAFASLERPHSQVHNATKRVFDLMLTEDEQYDAHQFAQALEEMERGSEGVFATLDKMLAEKQAAAGA
ncbi:MAG: CZB domain-containing protein [Planctomycetales bacterium]|nr:CZB domain-containing protein [Planctomycetales bacterium]